MNRAFVVLGTLLLVLPPLVGLVLRTVPFDGQITMSSSVAARVPSSGLLMLLGGFLLLAGLLWKRP